jgi:hypothetical protein
MVNPKQLGFFDHCHPKSATINIRENHELMRLSDVVPWHELIDVAQDIRLAKVKAATGPDPRYQELLGAVVLMSVRPVTFREAEDLIAHYAPARYLCGLMDSSWSPDHITIFDFTQMLGPEGMDFLNRKVLSQAEDLGLLKPDKLMADTTAQEAKIPYPNEVGLMKRFTEMVSGAVKKAEGKFTELKTKTKEVLKKVKILAHSSHLFAKDQGQKSKVGKKMYHAVKDLHELLAGVIGEAERKLHGKSSIELERLNQVMGKLLPQILYFLETGFVASKKIIHLQMSELYSIVRGKSGRSVEFGLKWGINHISGFAMGFLMNSGNASDKKFCIQEHIEMFGEAPAVFGFDRGGYSLKNMNRAKKFGVRHVGIAPTGKTPWSVSVRKAEEIRRERAQVEGTIGVLKSRKYRFNKPDARSTRSMETYGHRSFLGFNLCKTLRELQTMVAHSQ